MNRDYPRMMFHPKHDPVTVQSEEEEAALGAGWSRIIPQAQEPAKYDPEPEEDEPDEEPEEEQPEEHPEERRPKRLPAHAKPHAPEPPPKKRLFGRRKT